MSTLTFSKRVLTASIITVFIAFDPLVALAQAPQASTIARTASITEKKLSEQHIVDKLNTLQAEIKNIELAKHTKIAKALTKGTRVKTLNTLRKTFAQRIKNAIGLKKAELNPAPAVTLQELDAYNTSLKAQFDTRLKSDFTKAEQDTIKAAHIEPDYLYALLEAAPNDTEFTNQQTVQYMWAQATSTAQSTTTKLRIALIDSGIDHTHEDLQGSFWSGQGCKDSDGLVIAAGCPYGGWDFVDNDNDPAPVDGASHATAVAGIIAAQTNNNLGIASLSRNTVELMPLKVASNHLLSLQSIIEAIHFAVENDADIINMSFGGYTYSQDLADAITYAESHGVIVVAAAGNQAQSTDTAPIYPASLPNANIIAVAATQSNGTLASFSNFGANTVDIAAPGVNVLTTAPGNAYQRVSGTSFATPFISASIGTRTVQEYLNAQSQSTELESVVGEGRVIGGGSDSGGIDTGDNGDISGIDVTNISEADMPAFLISLIDGTNPNTSINDLTELPSIELIDEDESQQASTTLQSTQRQELLTNGGFENGLSGWSVSGDFHADLIPSQYRAAHNGNRYAYLSNSNNTTGNNLSGSIAQNVYIPTDIDTATLSYWYNITTTETGSNIYDKIFIQLTSSNGTQTLASYSNTNDSAKGIYSKNAFNLNAFKGKNIIIYAVASTDSSNPTVFRLDDFSLETKKTIQPQNRKPNTPTITLNTTSISAGESITATALTTDPDGDTIKYYFKWGVNEGSSSSNYVTSGASASKTHTYNTPGTYKIKVRAKDQNGEYSYYSNQITVTVNEVQTQNSAPDTPTVSVPSSGRKNRDIDITVNAHDDDNDNVHFEIKWGDNSNTLITPSQSDDTTRTYTHQYTTNGTYTIQVRAVDAQGDESSWASKNINIYTPSSSHGRNYSQQTGSTLAPNSDNTQERDHEEVTAGKDPDTANELPISIADALITKTSDWLDNNFAADPVNIRTGSFELIAEDFAIKSRGVPIRFTRSYSSLLAHRNARIGAGWRINYDSFAYEDPSTHTITVYRGGAVVSIFTRSADGSYKAEKGLTDTITHDANHTVVKTLDGITYSFTKKLSNNLHQLSTITDKSGNTTTIRYTTRRGVNLPDKITDASGHELVIAYGADTEADFDKWDKIVNITYTHNGTELNRVTYDYNTALDLIAVRKEIIKNGQISTATDTYQYQDGRIKKHIDPRGTTLRNVYDGQGRVIEQYEYDPSQDAAGTERLVYEIAYDAASTQSFGLLSAGGYQLQDAQSCSMVKKFTQGGGNTLVTDSYCFNNDALNTAKVLDGKRSVITRNSKGLIASVSDGASHTTSFSYDARGRVVSKTLPDTPGWHTVITYEYQGNFDIPTKITTHTTGIGVSNTDEQKTIITTNTLTNNGLIATSTDALNHTKHYTYNPDGTVATFTDANSKETRYTYYPDGTLKEVIDANNKKTTFTYDARGNVASKKDANNHTESYEYDNQDNLIKYTDKAYKETLYQYDAEGHLATTTYPQGMVEVRVYNKDIAATLKSITRTAQGRAEVAQYTYDAIGNITSEQSPSGHITTYSYNDKGKISDKHTDLGDIHYTYYLDGTLKEEEAKKNGNIIYRTGHIYDTRGNEIETLHYTNGNSFVSEKFTYNGFNRLIAETDANNHTTTYKYDNAGRRTKAIDPKLKEINYQYDNAGNLKKEIDRRGNATNYEYDNLGRLHKRIDALSKETVYNYDNLTHITSVQDPLSHTMHTAYTPRGEVERITNALSKSTSYQYDALGNRTQTKDADDAITKAQYNPFSQLVSISDTVGTSTFAYTHGERTTTTDERGNETTHEYDAHGNETVRINPQGTRIESTYDLANHLTKRIIRASNGETRTEEYAYDQLGRQTSIKHSGSVNGSRTETFSYDDAGNITEQIGLDEQTITYEYDELNRQTKAHYPNNITHSTSYDTNGNVKSFTTPNGSTTYNYDELNRVTQKKQKFTDLPGKEYVSNFTYNADSTLKSASLPAGFTLYYFYDAAQQLEIIKKGTQTIATYAYTNAGKQHSITLGNGVQSVYAYTPANLIKSISTTKAGNTLWSETHTYDAAGNRKTSKDKDNQTNTYAYDALNQLTSASIAGGSSVSNKPECVLNTAGATTISATCRLSHNVQVQGNITIASNSTFIIASNAKLGINLHQHHIHGLTSSSGLYLEPGASIRNTVTPTPAGASTGTNLSYTYDAFGNRKSKTKNGATINYNYNTANELTGTTGASTATISHNTNGDITNDGTYTYQYNSQHQLTNITGNGKSIEYKYHGADRYKKTVNGTVHYYLNSGNDLSAELNAQGDIITTYISNIAEVKNTGTITYKSTDTMGSVVLLTDASGAVQGTNTYLPFGEATHTGNANSNLTFTNQEQDAESNLMYYNARYYNPELGRFMNRDINRRGDVLTHNDYIYTRNNPFKYTDPSGNEEQKGKEQEYDNVFYTTYSATKGLVKGVAQVVYGTGALVVNSYVHPINTGNAIIGGVSNFATEVAQGAQTFTDANGYREAREGYGITAKEISERSAHENSHSVGKLIAGLFGGKGVGGVGKSVANEASHHIRATTMRVNGAGKFKVKMDSSGRGYLQRRDIDLTAVNSRGVSSLNLMKNGRAPIGKDGNPINLHHDGQKMNSRLIELEQTYHQNNTSRLHKSKGPSQINRSKFSSEKRNYWKSRANDF